MRHVIPQVLFAGHRFGIVEAAGGRFVGTWRTDPRLPASPSVSEFATADGTVIARRVVTASGQTECWLRADLAELAEQALAAEAAESARIAADVISYSLGRDEARAADAGLSLEAYRQKRNHALARIDQRRGRSSVGM
jgi:hypothetical protein